MSKENNKNEKQKSKGIPPTSAHLIKGGERAQGDGRGRRYNRVVADPKIAAQSVTAISNFLSTFHGELFVKKIPDWQQVLQPLMTACDTGMRIMHASGAMVAMDVTMDMDTFMTPNTGLLAIIQRTNKKVAKASYQSGVLPKRVLSYSYYNPNPPKPGREHNIQGQELTFCIIACLNGAYNMPEQLDQYYAEFYLRIGQFEGVNPLTNEKWLEGNRQNFTEFTELDADPYQGGLYKQE